MYRKHEHCCFYRALSALSGRSEAAFKAMSHSSNMTGNKKLHFQALIRTGYVKKGGTAYVKRNFNHPMYRSGLYEPDIYSHDFCPVCEIPSEKAMDQKAQEHLPALSGTDQLIPATDFL